MRRKGTIVLVLAAVTLAVVGAARAITFGQLDTTNRFPHVGAPIFESDGEPAILCSGRSSSRTSS